MNSIEIKVSDIDIDKFNPFGATDEELIAVALDQAGLLKHSTVINGKPARDCFSAFHSKRELYRKSAQIIGQSLKINEEKKDLKSKFDLLKELFKSML